VTVNGQNRVQVQLAGEAPRIYDFGTPKALTMISGAALMQLEYTLPEPVENVLPGRIAIRDFALTRLEERETGREVSTVIGGRLRIGGRVHVLGAAERFLGEGSEGWIESIRLDRDFLSVHVYGRARSVTVCSRDECQDLSTSRAGLLWRRYRWYSAGAVAVYCAAVLALSRLRAF
jgi:hypothetical protein